MSANRLPVYTLAALSALAIVAGSAAGQDAAAVEAFLRRCEAARPAAIAEAKRDHEKARKAMATAQQGVVNRQLAKAEPLQNGRLGFPSTKAKADAVAAASADAKAAKELLDGLTRGDELPIAKLPGNWKIGDAGRLEFGGLAVIQIVDAENIIAHGR